MSLAQTCDLIAALTEQSTDDDLTSIAQASETHLAHAGEVLDAVENAMAVAADEGRVQLWLLMDKLVKQHSLYLDAVRPKLISLSTRYAPAVASPSWPRFEQLMKTSFSLLFGSPLTSLILMQLCGDAPEVAATAQGQRSQTALVTHRAALRSAGAFTTKAVAVERGAANQHKLQVKTLDSQMAMNVASSYAPAKPVEIMVADVKADIDAPEGFMNALPVDYVKNQEQIRRKRLREIMERNRQEQDRRQEQDLLAKVRGAKEGAESTTQASANGVVIPDFSDIEMPAELPRDEFGVKRANFPLGVRFLRDAIASCGGAVELEVIVNRISTMANSEAVAAFGNVREFLRIHTPTFRLEQEKGVWVVRLVKQDSSYASSNGVEELTWEAMECPCCSKIVKGRNFARHLHCRRCVTTQIALGLDGDLNRSPIAELAYLSRYIILRRDSFDGGDVDALTSAYERCAELRRFRLSSPRQFAPMLKALRIIRDRWLASKGVEEMDNLVVDSGDASYVNLFRTVGQYVHRLPIAWIEMGDLIDMCHRFTDGVLPAFNPPPRPADPRISLQNEYPGFLLGESDVDDEDEPSGEDEEFSDDEAPTFTFAPPVETAEALFTAGFDRDTKRLQHRMRSAPPMILQRVLQGDRTQTHSSMYAEMQRDGGGVRASAPPAATNFV